MLFCFVPPWGTGPQVSPSSEVTRTPGRRGLAQTQAVPRAESPRAGASGQSHRSAKSWVSVRTPPCLFSLLLGRSLPPHTGSALLLSARHRGAVWGTVGHCGAQKTLLLPKEWTKIHLLLQQMACRSWGCHPQGRWPEAHEDSLCCLCHVSGNLKACHDEGLLHTATAACHAELYPRAWAVMTRNATELGTLHPCLTGLPPTFRACAQGGLRDSGADLITDRGSSGPLRARQDNPQSCSMPQPHFPSSLPLCSAPAFLPAPPGMRSPCGRAEGWCAAQGPEPLPGACRS